jgi:hypothetical protein
MTSVTMRSATAIYLRGGRRASARTALARGWDDMDEAWKPKWRFAGFEDVAPTAKGERATHGADLSLIKGRSK